MGNLDVDTIKKGYDLRLEIEKELGAPSQRSGDNWTWPCPFHAERTTGGFHVYRDGYKCYSCGENGDIIKWRMIRRQETFLEAVRFLGGVSVNYDPAEQTRIATERAEATARMLESQIAEAQKALDELRRAMAWERYHNQLTEEARELWKKRGIPEFYQLYWKLGFDPDHVVWTGTTEWHTPTLTIPVFEPATWQVLNIKHRLLNPPRPNDKYRPERSGLPTALFVADPDEPVMGKTLLVEGEIKSMVSFITADDPRLQVIGLPGKTPRRELLDQLKECDPIYVCLDPDAEKETADIVKQLGKDRCRVIYLSEKIDDLINEYHLGKDFMHSLMRQAQRAK